MTLQLINEELFFVEKEEGEEKIQREICDLVGHEILDCDKIGETYTIRKGICKNCGKGNRYWKMSKKETEEFKKEMESLR